MESAIARATGMCFEPVAILFSDERPEKARQFKEGKWGCVMFMLGAATRGETAVFDRKTFGCPGGAVGLGFGNEYKNFPGGEDCFSYFLSARVALKRMLKEDVMTFATPFSLYEEMEKNVAGCFLERGTREQLMALKEKSR